MQDHERLVREDAMSENPESEESKLQKPASRYEVYAVGGTALQHALSAQLVLTTRLLKALVASEALSFDKAQELLRANAQALGKMTPGSEVAQKSVAHTLIGARLKSHAKALRGIAMKLKRPEAT
jgi:hypothetical protein